MGVATYVQRDHGRHREGGSLMDMPFEGSMSPPAERDYVL